MVYQGKRSESLSKDWIAFRCLSLSPPQTGASLVAGAKVRS